MPLRLEQCDKGGTELDKLREISVTLLFIHALENIREVRFLVLDPILLQLRQQKAKAAFPHG